MNRIHILIWGGVLLLLTGCFKIKSNDIPYDLLQFGPYEVGDVLIFKNRIGETDTLRVVKKEVKELKRLTSKDECRPENCGWDKHDAVGILIECSEQYYQDKDYNYLKLQFYRPYTKHRDHPKIYI